MSKKVKFKVKKGKLKVKLKSGDDGALPLGEGDIRGLLVLAMASAVSPDTAGALVGDPATSLPRLGLGLANDATPKGLPAATTTGAPSSEES